MSNYDSDSSLEEDENYTETNVLLGYASEDPVDDTFSQLGGHATWLDDSYPPSARLARCKVCNDMMALLLQLNGDLPRRFPGHERRLYLYACRKRQCRRKPGSIRSFRATRVAKSSRTQQVKDKQADQTTSADASRQTVGLGTQLFGGAGTPTSSSNTNPFAMGQMTASGANPFAPAGQSSTSQAPVPTSGTSQTSHSTDGTDGLAESYASKLSLNGSIANGHKEEPIEPWPDSPSLPRAFTRSYIDADYETLSVEDDVGRSTRSQVTEIDVSSGGDAVNGSGTAEDKELFESSMDKTFQRFADRLRHNPEQILRYEFDGTPLLYSSNDAVGRALHTHDQNAPNGHVTTTGSRALPSCNRCGAKRKFELQLTPHAIEMLEADEPASMALEGMDWGTIILGVCQKDCTSNDYVDGTVSYTEEWVGVQWEELTERPSASSGLR